jgi:hypothetical protein
MQNLIVHLDSATPLSSWAGPRAPALSTTPANRPAPPVSGTATRHCAAAHLSAPSLPALSDRHARARHTSPMSTALGPLHGTPLSPPFLSPLPSYRRAARSPLHSDPSSRAPELPHRSPHPDRHLWPPAAPSPSWIPAEHHRHPPLPGELLPKLPIPKISCKSLTPSPLPSYRILLR